MIRASVVIPNWNGMAHLPLCLEALEAQTFRDFETIIVDNASTDGSQDYVRTSWPDVRWVALDSNRGFPAAVNAGVQAATGDYVVLLNNDTKADPNWLQTLVAGMDDNTEFSFGSSKLLRFDAPGTIDSAGHTYSLWLGAADNVGEEQSAGLFSEPAWVFGVCAAASIYRRSLFDDIGVFDEDFFFTHEDVEFDLRANVAGHRGLLVPDAIVYHKRGASYEITPELHLMGVRNRIWVAGKNLPPLALALWLAGKVLRVVWWVPANLMGSSTARRARQQRLRGTRSAWHNVTIRDAVQAAGRALVALPAKRRSVRHVRRISSLELLRRLRSTRTPQPLSRRVLQER